MIIVSWLKLLLLEEEMLCYIIPSYSFSSIGWTCFNLCMYINSSKTGSCDFLNYMYVIVLEWKRWGWLHHWFKLDMKYRYRLIYGSTYNPSKHLTRTKPVAHVNASAIPWKKPVYYWNHHLMLSWMVFVPTLYIKVSVSYDRIINYV